MMLCTLRSLGPQQASGHGGQEVRGKAAHKDGRERCVPYRCCFLVPCVARPAQGTGPRARLWPSGAGRSTRCIVATHQHQQQTGCRRPSLPRPAPALHNPWPRPIPPRLRPSPPGPRLTTLRQQQALFLCPMSAGGAPFSHILPMTAFPLAAGPVSPCFVIGQQQVQVEVEVAVCLRQRLAGKVQPRWGMRGGGSQGGNKQRVKPWGINVGVQGSTERFKADAATAAIGASTLHWPCCRMSAQLYSGAVAAGSG